MKPSHQILLQIQHYVDQYGRLPSTKQIAEKNQIGLPRAHRYRQQFRIYSFIQAYQQQYGYAPSRREISAEMHIVVSAVQHHIQMLIEDGLLTVTPNIARSIQAVDIQPA